MDHSLKSYLERRTTEELRYLLKVYLGYPDPNPYLNTASLILQVFLAREEDPPLELTPEILIC